MGQRHSRTRPRTIQVPLAAMPKTMKYILTLLTTMLVTDSFGQELNGTINFTKEHRGFNMVEVTAKTIGQTKGTVVYAKSDSLGHFNLKLEESGNYRVSVSGPFEPDTTFNVSIRQNETLDLTISYPPKLCPYEEAKTTGVCPDGKHKDNVVPIIYGLIIGDEEFMKKVEKNEVELGGCMVTDCDPNWYCKTHARRF